MSNLPQLIRTARHLRGSQIARRIAYRCRRSLEESRYFDIARQIHQRVDGHELSPASVPTPCDLRGEDRSAELLAELKKGRLTLLNQQLTLDKEDRWYMKGGRSVDRLWKYTLHYHGWLAELAQGYADSSEDQYGSEITRHLSDWLDQCRLGEPGFHHYAWNSYAIATRLDNWRQLLAVLPASFWATRQRLFEDFGRSLAAQAQYLYEHIEWDLRANHLLRDALGLACAARMLGGEMSQNWMQSAKAIVREQLEEQTLSDGGHFERSAMYHVEVMRDLLKLATLIDDDVTVEHIRRTWRAMAKHVAWLRHPNGNSPQFNDGSLCDPSETLSLGVHIDVETDLAPKRGSRWFCKTGLAVWHGIPWTVFFDVGDVGPDYQPGHAHADSLTFECSYGDQRLFIDPGCHSYDHDERRRYDRSTRSHNTVCIDGKDSSEIWHIFRVGRRARTTLTDWKSNARRFDVRAAHDGYRHLSDSPKHERRIMADDVGKLLVVDRINGNREHTVAGGYLLGPGWRAETADSGWHLSSGAADLCVRIESQKDVRLNIERRPTHPDYGTELITSRLTWQYDGALPLEVRTTVEQI